MTPKQAVSITTPGQNALYSIAGTAGEIVSLKTASTALGPEGGRIEVLNPEGKAIATEAFKEHVNVFMKQVKFATTGTYTLAVDPIGPSTGSLTVTAYNASDVTGTISPTTEGETKTITLGVPGQYGRITFAGTSGQTITLKTKESTIASGWISVWDPENAKVSGSEANFAGEGARVEMTLSATGTYTILFEPTEEDTGNVKLVAYLGSHLSIVKSPASGDSTATLARSGLLNDHTARIARGTSSSSRAKSAQALTSRHTTKPTWSHPSTPAALSTHQGINSSSVTAEMRRFRPRAPSDWQPPTPGQKKSWDTGAPPTPWATLAPLQGISSATALTGQVLTQSGLPLAGVRITLEGTYLATQTDATGRFLLSGGVPGGHRVLVVEGEGTPGHERYGVYEIGVRIKAHQTNTLPYTIWLTPLDHTGDQHIDSPTTREVTLTTPQIPGLEVRLPAGTVITDASGHPIRTLNITPIPLDRPPFPLPAFSSPTLYFTVQPGRAYLSQGAQVIYPNRSHLPAGQRVPFWNYEPDKGRWYIYGYGTVTPNGKQVVPDPAVKIWEFTGAMDETVPVPAATGPGPGTTDTGGDPVDLGTGLFVYKKTDLTIPDTIPIVIAHTYRQEDLVPHSFGIGTAGMYDLRLWSNNEYKEADLILPDSGRVHYVRTSPGEGFKEAEYRSTSSPGTFYGSTIKWDQSVPGWDVALTNGLTYVFGEIAPLEAIRDRYGNRLTITREKEQTGNITQITATTWAVGKVYL